MRWGLLAVVLSGACRVREPQPTRALAQPGECDVNAEWDVLSPRLTARCKHIGGLAKPRRAALVLAFSPEPIVGEVVVRRGRDEGPVRRHFIDGQLRIDVLLEDACEVTPALVACKLPFNLIYRIANALALSEGLTFVEVYVGDVDRGLLRLTALRRASPTKFDLSTLAAISRANDGDLGNRCLGGDTDACVARSTAAYAGPPESKPIPEPTIAQLPKTVPDWKPPPAKEPSSPAPPAVIAIAQPTASCDGGSTKDCDVECSTLRFQSCLQASSNVRAKFIHAAATNALPMLLDRCDYFAKQRALTMGDEAVKKLRLSCAANAGLIDDAVDAIAGDDANQLVALSKTVDKRCPSCD